jgi:Family of unknown function (DUF5343)
MAEYPPYVNAYGKIDKLFNKIKEASVPTKFSQDFLSTVLGLRSSSYRAFIPLLKRLGFIDQANVPTNSYKDFREDKLSRIIMAKVIKQAYVDLYKGNEFAHKANKSELTSLVKRLTGAASSDKIIPSVVGTFTNLVKLANFDKSEKDIEEMKIKESFSNETPSPSIQASNRKMGLSYTINLNLPATTDIQVFNAIFRSLKEHIL